MNDKEADRRRRHTERGLVSLGIGRRAVVTCSNVREFGRAGIADIGTVENLVTL